MRRRLRNPAIWSGARHAASLTNPIRCPSILNESLRKSRLTKANVVVRFTHFHTIVQTLSYSLLSEARPLGQLVQLCPPDSPNLSLRLRISQPAAPRTLSLPDLSCPWYNSNRISPSRTTKSKSIHLPRVSQSQQQQKGQATDTLLPHCVSFLRNCRTSTWRIAAELTSLPARVALPPTLPRKALVEQLQHLRNVELHVLQVEVFLLLLLHLE